MRFRYFQLNFLKGLGYFLYAALLAVALLYWLFPSEDLCHYLQARAKRIDSRLVLNIDRIHPCLPFGLEALGTELFLKGKPDAALFSSERMIFKPRLWPLLHGRFDFDFEIRACGGEINGRFCFKEGGLGGPFEAVVKVKDIRIGDNKYLPVLLGHSIEGNLDGDICYSTATGLLTDGSGSVGFKLRDGGVRFSRPVVNFKSMEIKVLKTEMLIKDQRANVNRFELKSSKMNMTLQGSIDLEKELAKSGLALKGECELSGPSSQKTEGVQIRKSLSFLIEGPISKPKLILASSQVE